MPATPVGYRASAAQAAWAARMIELLAAAEADGAGAVNDGVLVDLVHSKQAREIRRCVALVQARSGR